MSDEQHEQAKPELSFIDAVKEERHYIKGVAEKVRGLHRHKEVPFNTEDIHPNIELAYRHLEDAAMRLGKVIQAADGGKSVYDK
jgi:hypothetical protein